MREILEGHDNITKLVEDATEHNNKAFISFGAACENSRQIITQLRTDSDQVRRQIAELPQEYDHEMGRRMLVFRRRINGMADAG